MSQINQLMIQNGLNPNLIEISAILEGEFKQKREQKGFFKSKMFFE